MMVARNEGYDNVIILLIMLKGLILIFIANQSKDGCSTSKPGLCENVWRAKGFLLKRLCCFLIWEENLLKFFLHILLELYHLAITSYKRNWEIQYFTFLSFRVAGTKKRRWLWIIFKCLIP